MMLEPWLVQKALDQLGYRRLTRGEQETVVKAPFPIDFWKQLGSDICEQKEDYCLSFTKLGNQMRYLRCVGFH